MKVKYVVISLFLCISITCVETPKYGVVYFYIIEDPFFYSQIDNATEEHWDQQWVYPALLYFKSGPGYFETQKFRLLTPYGEELLPEYCKRKNSSNWEPVATTHGINLTWNPISINQISGDFEIDFIFMIKADPTTEYVLKYSDEETGENTYPISSAALSKK